MPGSAETQLQQLSGHFNALDSGATNMPSRKQIRVWQEQLAGLLSRSTLASGSEKAELLLQQADIRAKMSGGSNLHPRAFGMVTMVSAILKHQMQQTLRCVSWWRVAAEISRSIASDSAGLEAGLTAASTAQAQLAETHVST